MNRTRGFTLVELLAVVSIMLVLMAVTFGTFSVFAERAGPDAVLATIQSYVNGARDYACSTGLSTRIYFTADASRPQDGTTISMRFLPVGVTDWDQYGQDVSGVKPMTLMEGTYVLKDLSLTTYPPVPAATDVTGWQGYDQKMYTALNGYGFDSGGKIKPIHQNFFIEFDPCGYLNPTAAPTANAVQNGLIVVKAPSGLVTGYAFYPLNLSAGTRLVFE